MSAGTVWLELGGRRRRLELPEPGVGALEYVVDGRAMRADVSVLQPGVMSLVVDGRQFRCVLDGDAVVVNGQRFPFVLVDPRSLRGRRLGSAGAAGPKPVKAPMPGRIVRVMVALGDEVAAQQGLLVMEAMKMQNELKSPKAGKVVKISVLVGETVQSGDVMVVVE